jgi:DHA3 family tetracycline resistance protein-like MFS transporter
MKLFKSLRHSAFALLFSGQMLSRLGDSTYKIALAWWILEKTGSAVTMGKVFIFSFTPMLVFMLLGGVAVDRYSRLRLMLFSDLVRGVVVSLVAWLGAGNRLEVWHIYVASTVFGFVSAFFQPAYSAIIPEIVPRDSLPSANSLTSLSKQLPDILGPALGAVVVAIGGTTAAFGINAFSFFMSAVCLLPLLKLTWSANTVPRQQGILVNLQEGIRTVLATPWLWITVTIASLANITFSGPIFIALPFLIKDHLHAGVRSLGMIYSMLALGSLATTIYLGRYTQFRRRGLLAYGSVILMGFGGVALGSWASAAGVALIIFLIGAVIPIFSLIWINTMQEFVPRELLGRVSSIDQFGSSMFVPIGFALVGWATNEVGASILFIVGGCLTAALGVLALLHPAIRNLD